MPLFIARSSFAACALLLATTVTSADSRIESIRSVDGHPLTITYYPVSAKASSGDRENAPVVVLLHGSDKGRILWDKAAPGRGETANFAETLQADGYAVITVDLRKFGDSKSPGDIAKLRPDDYEKMAASDMFAVKQFIFERHQEKDLNMNKMAIVAAGPTAAVAINFAAADLTVPPYDDAPVLANRTPRGQDVRALVLLSPEMSAGRLNSNRAMSLIKSPNAGIAMLVVVGAQDTADKGQSEKVFELMEKAQRKDEKRVYKLSPALRDRELGLIGKVPDQVEVPIRNFLNKHVKEFPSAWRDRKNKVTG
ncbi:Alpha/beta hydrolase family protein [Caulifigura coniformis]|uniref:Alpha/beta hydrolase family protein n=1 Tax=Caulifigura coniformis TaxID=2527983 RepID=A0A517S7G3_9PLAN|nr:alpha/beta hydrolase [Caulifigura coniformis]QDT52066.1 Alpha/beta hydrolase family protein [Caulifigura coniformis]